MDTTELVIAIEHAFSINMSSEKTEEVETVGDVFDWIVDNFDAGDSYVCLSAATFYAIRSAVGSLGHDGRIHPTTETRLVLPKTNQQRYWERFEEASSFKLPPLRLPAHLETICVASVLIAVGIVVGLTYVLSQSMVLAMLSAVPAAVSVFVVVEFLTRPYAVVPPSTFRALTEHALGLNFKQINQRYGSANKSDIWVALRLIIADEFGVDPHRITCTTNFVRDLGCD